MDEPWEGAAEPKGLGFNEKDREIRETGDKKWDGDRRQERRRTRYRDNGEAAAEGERALRVGVRHSLPAFRRMSRQAMEMELEYASRLTGFCYDK